MTSRRAAPRTRTRSDGRVPPAPHREHDPRAREHRDPAREAETGSAPSPPVEARLPAAGLADGLALADAAVPGSGTEPPCVGFVPAVLVPGATIWKP
ncbi:hypothetical protein [Streptomyces sp. SA3_actF]|uniref:hypothetical protein n=1 Tax=Streptomyces sp. SA3_actF TaxID=682181 RepID=UPI0002000ED8|nr:hypothetical protein [Streptomyces sp. SA3_actF]